MAASTATIVMAIMIPLLIIVILAIYYFTRPKHRSHYAMATEPPVIGEILDEFSDLDKEKDM